MDDNEKALLSIVALIVIAVGLGSNVLTPQGTPAIPGMRNVFCAVIAGLMIGLLGYMQKTDLPNWETAKFFITLTLSAVAGYVAYRYDMSFQNAYTWLAVMGFDVLVERLIKTFIRRAQSQFAEEK